MDHFFPFSAHSFFFLLLSCQQALQLDPVGSLKEIVNFFPIEILIQHCFHSFVFLEDFNRDDVTHT